MTASTPGRSRQAVLSVLQEWPSTTPVLVAVDDITMLDRATASALGFASTPPRRFERRYCWPPSGKTTPGPESSDRSGGSRPEGRVPVCAQWRRQLCDGSSTCVSATGCRSTPRPGWRPPAAGTRSTPSRSPTSFCVRANASGAGPLPVPGELRQLLTCSRQPVARAGQRCAVGRLLPGQHAHTNVVDASGLRQAEDAGLVTIEPTAGPGSPTLSWPPPFTSLRRRGGGGRSTGCWLIASRTPEERARHLALGAEGPDIEIAGQLDEAAKLAQARGSPAAAAELVELALQMTPTIVGAGRAERMLHRGRTPLRDRRSWPGAGTGRTSIVGSSRQPPSRLRCYGCWRNYVAGGVPSARQPSSRLRPCSSAPAQNWP